MTEQSKAYREQRAPSVDSAAVRAVLRWLPTVQPSGAFNGQHDLVHLPEQGIHARVCLWWSAGVVHPGDVVGPPRGGLVPANADYAVALPAGGFLLVDAGRLVGWSPQPVDRRPLVRADGEHFDPADYGPSAPYTQAHYLALSAVSAQDALRRSRSGLEDLPVRSIEVEEILQRIAVASNPVVCGCVGQTPTSAPTSPPWQFPRDLLGDPQVLRVLTGIASRDETVALLWKLTAQIWDPARVGRAMAAESVARAGQEASTDWPSAPMTEQIVAQVAAQGLRHHGVGVVRRMPAWLLGWVMIAEPVLAEVAGNEHVRADALLVADQVRLSRVDTQWHAMTAARALLEAVGPALDGLDDPTTHAWHTLKVSETLVDIRHSASVARPDQVNRKVAGTTVRDAVRMAYRSDVRSWVERLCPDE